MAIDREHKTATVSKETMTDEELLAIATERIASADPHAYIPAEQLYRELGISEDELESTEAPEIE